MFSTRFYLIWSPANHPTNTPTEYKNLIPEKNDKAQVKEKIKLDSTRKFDK